MSVQTKAMASVFLFLNLIFLVCHDEVNAFHVDKPMIHIGFFGDVVTTSENASSKLIDKGLPTTSNPLNGTKEIKKRHDLLTDLIKLNDENKTSPSELSESVFVFDVPSKADITEVSTNELDNDHSTTPGISDLMDPELLEPELTRMFFMRAIASMIEHLMVALFSVEEPPKLSEPNFDYETSPSRNIKKRDLSLEDDTSKVNTAYLKQMPESETGSISKDASKKKITAHSMSEIKSTEQAASSDLTHASESLETIKKLLENHTEQSSPSALSTSASEHTSSHHSTHKTTAKSHASKRENEAKASDNIPAGKVVHRVKLVAHRSVAVKPEPIDEDNMKEFQFIDEIPIQNDEVANKRETRSHKGIHPAESDETPAENLADIDHNKTSFNEILFLVGVITLVLMIFGGLALAAGYVLRKHQESAGDDVCQCSVA